jgi:ribonucleoside-diphosphate reductase alpha chain
MSDEGARANGEASAPENDCAIDPEEDYVINRLGQREPIRIELIVDRIRDLSGAAYGRRLRYIKRMDIEKLVISGVKSGMTTREIDELAVQACESLTARHPEYSILAARFTVNNLHKENSRTFPEIYEDLYTTGKSRIHAGFIDLVRRFGDVIEGRLVHRRDYNSDGLAIATMMRSYLLRGGDGELVELPQHMYMRVALMLRCFESGRALGLSHNIPIRNETLLNYALEDAFKVYELLSLKLISHASPTITNAGCTDQLASCFLTQVDDSFENLYEVLKACAIMSKNGGGLSICIDRMRCEGAPIKSSGGKSQGVMPYLTMTNYSQLYANQGGTGRPGAYACYYTPHGGDVLNFLAQALPKGTVFDQRKDAHRLKFALFIPDLFMRVLIAELNVKERVRRGEVVDEATEKAAGDWFLFSADSAPGLDEVYDERSIHHPDGPGGSYSDRYYQYLREGRSVGKIKASAVIRAAVAAIGHIGSPYMLWRDHINRGSNLAYPSTRVDGVIVPGRTVTCSNLCAEVTIPTRSREGDPDGTLYAVCNLGAITLPKYLTPDLTAECGYRIEFGKIIESAGVIAENLDGIIDLNFLPVEGCHRSNQLFRTIGVGVIGMADMFLACGFPFGSPDALRLDAAIHACIYYGVLLRSSELGERKGNYPAYRDSGMAKGLLRPDLAVKHGFLGPDWAFRIEEATDGLLTVGMWDKLRSRVMINPETGEDGFCRNGELTCDMPTATSSNAAGGEDGGMTEGIDPPTTFMYTRKTLAGERVVLNSGLVKRLKALGIWSDEISSMLEADEGSIASWDGTGGRPNVPIKLRQVYRTARELDQKLIAIHAGTRQSFLSMSQSVNTFWGKISTGNLLEYWITSFLAGASTASYYCHSQAKAGTQKTGIRRDLVAKPASGTASDATCRFAPGGGPPDPDCAACSV